MTNAAPAKSKANSLGRIERAAGAAFSRRGNSASADFVMTLTGTVGLLAANLAITSNLSLPNLKSDLARMAALYRKMGHPRRADLFEDIAAMIEDMSMAYANQHRAEASL